MPGSSNTIAWIVAIQKYAAPELELKAPIGLWALELAQLLIEKGTDPANVVVSFSLSEDPLYADGLAWLREKSVLFTGATEAELPEALDRLSDRNADCLLIYWVGHGIYDEKRLMLAADSKSPPRLLTLSADSILAHLRSPEFPRLQIGFFECCAQTMSAKPGVRTLSGEGRTATSQYFYHAASVGNLASATTKEPGFSSTVIRSLRDTAAFPPPPGPFFQGLSEAIDKLPLSSHPFLQQWTEGSGDTWSRSSPSQISTKYPHVGKLNEEVKGRRKLILAGTAQFDIRLRLCGSFADALETQRTRVGKVGGPGYESRDLSPAEFARYLSIGVDADEKPLSAVLLHAPGGAGKSSFLLELLSLAPNWNLVPFFLDLSRSRESANRLKADAKAQFQDWFVEGGAVGSVELLFDLARDAAGPKPLLVVDGLNQASVNWRDVLRRIEGASNQDLARAAIVIADRLVDHNPGGGLRRAVIMPLSQAVYAAALPPTSAGPPLTDYSWQPILSSPLFLNKFLRLPGVATAIGQAVIPSRFSVLDQYFRESEGCNFSLEQMRALAEFAYSTYDIFRGTAFPNNRIEELLYNSSLARLDVEGAATLKDKIAKEDLIQDLGSGLSQFQHQILHDQLAAMKVASATIHDQEVLWRAGAFDVLSLDSASSDAIELTFEALQKPDRLLTVVPPTDLNPWAFLTDVYDWNYRTALECIASLDRRGERALRPWMRHAVYGLNLERAFDPFLYTSVRTDQLRAEIPPAADLTYLDAKNAEELRQRVKDAIAGLAETTGELEEWRKLYTREEPFSPGELNALWGDPLLSWTAANVVRRLAPDESVTAELIRLYEISKATSDSVERARGFRWRLVHALGRAKPSAREFLLRVVFNPLEGQHVRYGAIRSLVEVTVLNGTEADQVEVFDSIKGRLSELFPPTAGPRAAGNRLLLRQCCAFNEPFASGRPGWLDAWTSTGLPKYKEILRTGAQLASDRAIDETAAWDLWADTVEKAAQTSEWSVRYALWKEAIGKD